MRNIYPLVILLALVIFSSCRKEDDPIPEPEIRCQKLDKNSYVNGELYGTTDFFYDHNGILTDEVSYDTDGNKDDSTHYEYDHAGRVISSEYVSFNFTYSQILNSEYFPDGKLKYTEIIVNRSVSSSSEFHYNSNGEIDSVYTTSYGTPGWAVYSYKDDKIDRIETFNANGILNEAEEYSYVDSLTIILMKDRRGQLTNRVETIVDEEGRQIEWRSYYLGKLYQARLTDYDDRGNVTNVKDIYSDYGVYDFETIWECK